MSKPSDDNKFRITVLYRVEPGCLGPTGVDYIEEFCRYAQAEFEKLAYDAMAWQIVPRYDKTLAEIQYQLGGKNLSKEQAAIYFDKHGINFARFEELLDLKIADLIEQHLGRLPR
ncbi:hypothetical protein HR45_03925 [Shewanella mangrovi]|uniref:Uncharacterized protein n=1 Tax=Shewanella mangrovi TaxID=1515746 RepID=A0A094K1P0_9GAMM|nr:hypothetical protein [Shewanella mangrovi]KFZ38581.1 hypothetical protein HR45_03925 [Shewanella mangrovi]